MVKARGYLPKFMINYRANTQAMRLCKPRLDKAEKSEKWERGLRWKVYNTGHHDRNTGRILKTGTEI
jgi:hypothetical protein